MKFLLLFFVTFVIVSCSVNVQAEICGEKCQELKSQLASGWSWLWGGKGEDEGARSSNDDYVIYRWYTKNTLNNPVIMDSRNLSKFQGLALNKPIRITVHGWWGYEKCPFTTAMLEGFLPHFDYNVITVDWSHHGSQSKSYVTARSNVVLVAYKLSEFLDNLKTQNGVRLEDIHVIGHSLGAHISGIAGQVVKQGKIGRISGMDPAGPLFSENDSYARLCTESAKFVDVIHTSTEYLGYTGSIGHVDFFPNGGTVIQPGCGKDISAACSHARSYHFFVESLTNPKGFPAVSCQNWEQFKAKTCNKKDVVHMGNAVPRTARGNYYLATYAHAPYGKSSIY